MKKLAIGFLSAAFILGAGTYVFAQESVKRPFSFEEMKPFMEERHPNLSEKELKDLYQNCPGPGNGRMMGHRNGQNMMNNF